MAAYTDLYAHLSKFIKKILFGELSSEDEINTDITRKEIVDFLSYLEKWDSEHGILLTLDTSKIMFPLLKDLHDFLKKYRSDEEFGLKFEMKKWEWQKRIAELESAIKNEVGIYTIKPFPDNISYNPISNYGELSSDAS